MTRAWPGAGAGRTGSMLPWPARVCGGFRVGWLVSLAALSCKRVGYEQLAHLMLISKQPHALCHQASDQRYACPLAAGREDPWVVPLWGQRLRRQLPSATYLELSPAGHCPHHEAPSAVSRCIHEWVAAQESGQALPLDVGQAWQVRESSQVVQVTHVNGAPRNVFEIFDYWTWRLRMAVQQAVMGQPAQATIDV